MSRSPFLSSSVQQALTALALGATLASVAVSAHARSDAQVNAVSWAQTAAQTQIAQAAATDAAPTRQAAGTEAFQQVPGVHRQQIGSLQVTALLDGVLWLPYQAVQGISASKARTMLQADFVPLNEQGIHTAVNAFLVKRGDRLMLVDAGAAQCFGPTTGKLLENLRASGTAPEAITDVLLTHAHPDHACGLIDSDGKAVFPHATVWLPGAEAAFWLNADMKAKAPKDDQKYFDMAASAVKPYDEAGRLKRFGDGDALPPGTRVFRTPGHTPGHVSWLIDGGENDKLLVWGDIVHFHALQFQRPRVYAGFDVDSTVAIASRQRIMARAAKARWWVGGAHLPFPGIGHVAPQGKAYRWVPAEFGPVGKP